MQDSDFFGLLISLFPDDEFCFSILVLVGVNPASVTDQHQPLLVSGGTGPWALVASLLSITVLSLALFLPAAEEVSCALGANAAVPQKLHHVKALAFSQAHRQESDFCLRFSTRERRGGSPGFGTSLHGPEEPSRLPPGSSCLPRKARGSSTLAFCWPTLAKRKRGKIFAKPKQS